MYSDTFLPLDDYMSDAKHMKPEEWNQTILESGRTEEGQVVLPVQYTFHAFAFQSACLKNPGEIPSSLEEILACEDPLIGEYLRGNFSRGELEERIVTATWQFARRQLTWFRGQHKEAVILPMPQPTELLLERIAAALGKKR